MSDDTEEKSGGLGKLAMGLLGTLKGPIQKLSAGTRRDLARSTGRALKELTNNIDGDFDEWVADLLLDFIEDAVAEYRTFDPSDEPQEEPNPFKK